MILGRCMAVNIFLLVAGSFDYLSEVKGGPKGLIAAACASLRLACTHASSTPRPCPLLPRSPGAEAFWGSADIFISRLSVPSLLHAASATHALFSCHLLMAIVLFFLSLWVCSSFVCFKSLLSLWWDSRREINITFTHKFLSIEFERIF